MVIQEAEFDGQGRRIKKIVTKSGDLDGTFVYSYDSSAIIEVRDGSNVVVNQVYRGTEYIDEIVGMRLEEGYAVILQDANFNVVGAVDMAGQVLERVFYEPYGLPVFEGETRFGDYDGNHSVDSTDDASLGNGQTCWGANPTGACRVFDFNFDLTLDSSDETVMTALTSLSSNEHRVYGRTTSPLGLRFLHQGLEFDPEITSYQNRARQYLPVNERFAQRDPMGYSDGLTLYLYQLSSPLVYRDPTGKSCICGERINAILIAGVNGARAGRNAAIDAISEAPIQFPGPTCVDNACDAFRHCFWSCLMAIDPNIGPIRAKQLGDSHEECNPGTPCQASMDLHNNAWGVDFGTHKVGRPAPATSREGCKTSCKDAAQDGRLVTKPCGGGEPPPPGIEPVSGIDPIY